MEIPQSSNPLRLGFYFFGMTRAFGNNVGRSGGPPVKNSFSTKTSIRRPAASSPKSLQDGVIPNSDNHDFTGYDLILHRLAEEGSPYRVQEHFYLALRSSRLLLKLSINLTFFDLEGSLICFSWQLPHIFLQTALNTSGINTKSLLNLSKLVARPVSKVETPTALIVTSQEYSIGRYIVDFCCPSEKLINT